MCRMNRTLRPRPGLCAIHPLKDSPATSGCGGPASLVEVTPPGVHEGGAVRRIKEPLDRDLVPPPGHVVEEGPRLERPSRLDHLRPALPATRAESGLCRDVAEVLTPAPDVLLVAIRVGSSLANDPVRPVTDVGVPDLRPPVQRDIADVLGFFALVVVVGLLAPAPPSSVPLKEQRTLNPRLKEMSPNPHVRNNSAKRRPRPSRMTT
jgi:hypothetical protein